MQLIYLPTYPPIFRKLLMLQVNCPHQQINWITKNNDRRYVIIKNAHQTATDLLTFMVNRIKLKLPEQTEFG